MPAQYAGQGRRFLVLPLLLLAAVTAWLAVQHQRLRFDPHNTAMKSVGTQEAAATARYTAAFGPDCTLLLAFTALPGLTISAEEHAALRDFVAGMGEFEGVAHVGAPHQVDAALTTVAVQLIREASAADAVIARARAACPPSLALHGTGLPVIEQAIARGVAGDRQRIVPLIAAMLVLLLAVLYRRPALVLGTLVPGVMGIAWTGGILQLLGHQLDPIAILLEPVLLTVGVAEGVHCVEAWLRRAAGRTRAEAARAIRRELMLPATLAALTTMVGFWSLCLNPIPAVADFGVAAAFGTGLTHGFAMWLLPAWLSCFVPSPQPPEAGTAEAVVLVRRLAQRRGVILVSASSILALAASQWPRLAVDNDPLQLLAQDHPARTEHAAVAARLGSAEVFHVLAPVDEVARAPDRLQAFAARIAAQPPVSGLIGPVRQAANGEVALDFGVRHSGSAVRSALFEGIRADARRLGLGGVVPAGDVVQIAVDSRRLVRGHLFGLFGTLAVLFLVMAIGLCSLRLALLGIIPNALPCLLLYGGLAVLGEPLTVAGSMIGSVLLGLVVDNTIHLLHHYRTARRGLPPGLAVAQALLRIGRPMRSSALVLACGFATALGGSMRSTQEFGAMAVFVVAVAWYGDAILLPVMLVGPGRCVTR